QLSAPNAAWNSSKNANEFRHYAPAKVLSACLSAVTAVDNEARFQDFVWTSGTMSSKRQPKLGIGLRICAVFSLFAWLAVSSHCATEFLFAHSHESAGHEHADADHHEHDADAPSQGTSGHSHDSGS